MGERQTRKEFIGRGELFFLSHPGKEEIFSGYGLTLEEGSKGKLVGLLMVDRPWPVDSHWLKQIEENFGEYQLVPMTATGERGIVCRMDIEQEGQKHLRQHFTEKAAAISLALRPLLEELPKTIFRLQWDDQEQLWRSRFVNPSEYSDT